jgi:hypothetical protein
MFSRKKLIIILGCLLLTGAAAATFFYFREPYPIPVDQTVPEGWVVLTNEEYSIRAIVPPTLEYHGCTLPTALGPIAPGVDLALGVYWTPCMPSFARRNEILKESKDPPEWGFFDDTFSGYTFRIEENISSGKAAQAAVEKNTNGRCKLNVIDWRRNKWEIVEGRPPANQWLPGLCGIDGGESFHGFYNAKKKIFVYWRYDGHSFPIGEDRYADDRVKIFPIE